MEERNRRKEEAAEKKEQAVINQLVTALRSRSITTGIKGKVDSEGIFLDLSSIEPSHPAAVGKRVHLVGDSLVWPVLFLYPEYGETDFVQEFHEDDRFVLRRQLRSQTLLRSRLFICYFHFLNSFIDHLNIMFEETPLWDSEGKYNPSSIKMYYEHRESGVLHIVDPKKNLKEVLSQKT